MTIKQDNIVMKLMRDDLHERFGPAWLIDVLEHPEDDRGVVCIRIRRGDMGEHGAVAANANMLMPHLKLMVEGKCIQEQVHEAIGNDWQPHLYLNKLGLNTCQQVYEHVLKNLQQYAWTEQNNPE